MSDQTSDQTPVTYNGQVFEFITVEPDMDGNLHHMQMLELFEGLEG